MRSRECAYDWRVWLVLSPTPKHTDVFFFAHMLWRLPARRECLPFYLRRRTRRMTDDHPRHLSRAHCARSLSRRSQFSVCGRSHIPHIVVASSPDLAGRWVFFFSEVGIWCATCGALIAPSGNRHLSFRFLFETQHSVSFSASPDMNSLIKGGSLTLCLC